VETSITHNCCILHACKTSILWKTPSSAISSSLPLNHG
jgi:hypothetical protein